MSDPIAVHVEVDGQPLRFTAEGPAEPLVDALRRHGRTGTHVGCANGDCGACTVLMDGVPLKSCVVPVWRADGHQVQTIEGLARHDGTLDPVQRAFLDENGFQCGFCLAGPVLCVKALVLSEQAGDPLIQPGIKSGSEQESDDERAVAHAIAGNLCRCTGYRQIVQAGTAAVRRSRRPA